MAAANNHNQNHRFIPPELAEAILLKFPHKSLIRFLSVSRQWNSTIQGPNFVKRYRCRKLILFLKYRDLRDSFECPLLNLRDRRKTPLASPFGNQLPNYLHAICDELWCVEVQRSLHLWNPSTQTCRRLPKPSLSPWPTTNPFEFSYGLGYDSASDDYKMVKIHKTGEAELYSLRSNSWREIRHRAHPSFGRDRSYSSAVMINYWNTDQNVFHEYNLRMAVFLSGALHWLTAPLHLVNYLRRVKLISFDLSTEKYGELQLPELDLEDHLCQIVVNSLKGVLCLCINYRRSGFVLWMMEEYGVVRSWTKKLHIDFKGYPCLRYCHIIGASPVSGICPTLRPFYFDENGNILMNVCLREKVYRKKFKGNYEGKDKEEVDRHSKIFVYNVDDQTLVEKYFSSRQIYDSFVYVESFVLLQKHQGSI